MIIFKATYARTVQNSQVWFWIEAEEDEMSWSTHEATHEDSATHFVIVQSWLTHEHVYILGLFPKSVRDAKVSRSKDKILLAARSGLSLLGTNTVCHMRALCYNDAICPPGDLLGYAKDAIQPVYLAYIHSLSSSVRFL